MDTKELLQKIREINLLLPDRSQRSHLHYGSFYILTKQFVKNYLGADTDFYKTLTTIDEKFYPGHEVDKGNLAIQTLKSIQDFLTLELEIKRNEKYQLKYELIDDFLIQTTRLINDKNYHPAAAAILMGASLEEFLKKLAINEEIDIDNKATIDSVSKKLYEQNIISKQDMKDITSWAGIRNDATHGNFEAVNDRKRLQNALEGINLFIRKTLDN